MSRNYGSRYRPVTLQSAAVATGNGTAVKCTDPFLGDEAVLVMQVQGITTATITWEGTIDGTNWVAMGVTTLADTSTVATTATADGLYKVNVRGISQFRARISAWTTGTISVTGNLVSVA